MKKIILIICVFSVIANAQIKLELVKTLSGNNSTDQLSSIVALGDINNDGYDDFALKYFVKSDSSYAKIYFGGKPFDSTKTVVFTNPKPKFYFTGIIGGGDINGDGVKDFLITYVDHTAIHNPSQYELQVHFGGKPISQEPDYTIICSALNNCMINGDYNGDGFDDIIVSRLMDNYWGSIFIYFGGKSLKAIPNLELNGLQYAEFARYSTMLGDVNNDGNDDLIASARIDSYSYPKAAFLFWGGDKLSFDSSTMFTDTQVYGLTQSALGDINRDGYKDFFIAEVYRDIFLGSKQVDPQKPLYRFGKWMCDGIGDINKDGYSDFVRTTINEIEVHLGSSTVDTIPDFILNMRGDLYYLGDIDGNSTIELGYMDYTGMVPPTTTMRIYSVLKGTSVQEGGQLPQQYSLGQNYPNPFNPETTISYSIPKSDHVTLKVYDLLGREIATLVNEYKQPGNYKVIFNVETLRATSLPSGIYFYKLQSGGYSEVKKLVLAK